MVSGRPNILHLFTDQQRWDTIRALGAPWMRTPTFDRLAAEGVAFTSAYSPSPVCAAARCCMLLGQYPWHTGLFENGPIRDDRITLVGGLTAAGYRTHGIGKCHAPKQQMLGFQTREVQEEGSGGDDYQEYLRARDYRHVIEPFGVRGELYYIPQVSQLPPEDHPTAWVASRAIDFIEGDAGGSTGQGRDRGSGRGAEPWYLYASFVHPHPPFSPPVPWHKLYRASQMPLPRDPPDVDALLTFVNHAQNRYKYRDQGSDLNLVRAMRAHYYACISFIDHEVGRIVESLERTGQWQDTVVLLSADHGEHLGDYGCYGKRSMHDTAARVPMIVRWPGVLDGGERCDKPVSLVDIAPTLLAAGDGVIDSHQMDGINMADIATGRSDRELVFGQLSYHRWVRSAGATPAAAPAAAPAPPPATPATADVQPSAELIAARSSYMAVSGRWKYVYNAPEHRELLFDRVEDPQELRSRANLVFCQDACSAMRGATMDAIRGSGPPAAAAVAGDDWVRYPSLDMPADPDQHLLIQDELTDWADLTLPGYTSPAEGP